MPTRKSGLTPKTTYRCENRTLYNHSIVSIVFGVNPLFLGGLHIEAFEEVWVNSENP